VRSKSIIVHAALFSVVAALLSTPASGGTVPPPQKIHASDGTPGDVFAADVAIRGDVSVIAAGLADGGHGAAYVFRRNAAGVWNQEQKLITSGAAIELGGSVQVATDGNVIVIGRPLSTWISSIGWLGSVYVFRRNALGYWQEEAKFTEVMHFGGAVAIDGDWLFVGNPDDDEKATDAGAVRVFRFDPIAKSWSLHQKVFAAPWTRSALFGWSLDAAGDAFVASADDWIGGTWTKTLRVFRRGANDVWAWEATLTPSDPKSQWSQFGTSIDIDDDRIVAGAPDTFSTPPANSSAVYVFERASSGAWRQTAKLLPPVGEAGFEFGLAVALRGDRALIGSPMEHAFVFDLQGNGTWTHFGTATAPDQSDNNFGEVVALADGIAAIGAAVDADLGLNAGAAYLYDFNPPIFVGGGSGCPGSGGVIPHLFMTGAPISGGQLQVSITNGVGSGSALLAVGLGPGFVSMGYGCTLNIAPVPLVMLGPLPLFPLGAQGAGAGSISFGATLPPSLPPVTIGVQAFVVDSGVAHGFANTNGVVFTIQ
jgi:hypothetical protein